MIGRLRSSDMGVSLKGVTRKDTQFFCGTDALARYLVNYLPCLPAPPNEQTPRQGCSEQIVSLLSPCWP